jgi:hypothetical protein
MRIVYAAILIAAYVYLVVFMPVDAIPQLKHHELQPESCQDRISRQRHVFMDAAMVVKNMKAIDRREKAERIDALMNWYADTSNGDKVRYACSTQKGEANISIRIGIAEYFIATSNIGLDK